MRVRETFLKNQIEHAECAHEPREVIGYLQGQLEDLAATLEQFNTTPFSDVATATMLCVVQS
jgi:hypothetical protein